jgi:hypothetical protein
MTVPDTTPKIGRAYQIVGEEAKWLSQPFGALAGSIPDTVSKWLRALPGNRNLHQGA